MRTVAVVPVKALGAAKSRLAAVLTPRERATLTLRTLRTVLDALDLPRIAARLVVSPDPAVLATARDAGAATLVQRVRDPATGLNDALDEARGWAEARDAGALLVVLGDLPLLARGDVAALLALAAPPVPLPRGAPPGSAAVAPPEVGGPGGAPAVVLAPDRRERGTNALLLRPPAALPFAFGPDSLARHHAAAAARGLPVRLYRAPGAALDLDTPDDLAALRLLRAEHRVASEG